MFQPSYHRYVLLMDPRFYVPTEVNCTESNAKPQSVSFSPPATSSNYHQEKYHWEREKYRSTADRFRSCSLQPEGRWARNFRVSKASLFSSTYLLPSVHIILVLAFPSGCILPPTIHYTRWWPSFNVTINNRTTSPVQLFSTVSLLLPPLLSEPPHSS